LSIPLRRAEVSEGARILGTRWHAAHCGSAMAAPVRRAMAAAAPRPWRLFGALCLLRLPRVTQPMRREEEEMAALMGQIELEKSRYSDHELRKLEEEEQLRRRKESGYDDDEGPGQTVIMAQDLEDKWEQKLQRFRAAPRVTDADKNNIRTSLERKLDSNLMLLVKQKVGDQELWLLPQAEWQPGETLRSTAERALAASLDHIQAKFLGNAPYGHYKYKFPRAIRTEDNMGAKVFFFKAFLQSNDLSQAELKEDFLWVTKDELGDYLKSEYLKKVSRFLLDL
uniref:Large ribosomal subunit protein mL46 n=1 Tax=Nothoprocta perdicaria TaxID=30464 RepID=A0A8C6ZXI3_NOTPE